MVLHPPKYFLFLGAYMMPLELGAFYKHRGASTLKRMWMIRGETWLCFRGGLPTQQWSESTRLWLVSMDGLLVTKNFSYFHPQSFDDHLCAPASG